MGALFSGFRKKQKSYKDTLEDLDNDLSKLSAQLRNSVYREKSFISWLLFLSFLFYLIGAIIFYLYFSPDTWLELGLYSIPLVLFPILVYMVKKLLNMFFAHKKAQLTLKLTTLQAEKRSVLKEMMDKETYNVAMDLLRRFDPQNPSLLAMRERRGQGERNQQQRTAQARPGELRQRRPATQTSSPPHTPHPSLQHQHRLTTQAVSRAAAGRPSHSPTITPSPSPTSTASQAPTAQPHANSNATQPQPSQALPPPSDPPPSHLRPSPPPPSPSLPPTHAAQFIPPGMCLGPAPGPPNPVPILPRDRSSLDKMVEYLVGDGPNNRYALICSSCLSHNGMALQDEFEFLSFRCAYCYHLNPARRDRPPLLPRPQPLHATPTEEGVGLQHSPATNQIARSERRGRGRGDERAQAEPEATAATPDAIQEVEGQSSPPRGVATPTDD